MSKGVATSAGACMAVFPLYFPLNAAVAYLSAVRSRRATIGTQVGCVIWHGNRELARKNLEIG